MKQSNHDKYTLEELIEMIPLYINGAMTNNEKTLFEKSLQNNEELVKEYRLFDTLNNAFKQEMSLDASKSDALFNKIEQSINRIEKAPANQTIQASNKISLVETLKSWLVAPQLAWGITAALSIFIVTTSIPNIESNSATRYQTLSQKTEQSNHSDNLIQVVFKKDSTYNDITRLLQQSQTEIVTGFKSDGVVYLRAKDNRSAIEQLSQSTEILFVEQSMQ